MKIILSIIFSFALIILLSSCTIEPIFYHSEASLPYFHKSTKTTFQLVKDDNATSTFPFGVIAAKDNDTLSYVLLAPGKSKNYYDVNDLTDVNLSHAIPLLPEQVMEFIRILNSSAGKWNTRFDAKEGISYEFMVSPEDRIVPKSENVNMWYSTFKFYFQNNLNGPIGTIIFGEGLMKYFYTLEKVSEIRDLSSILSIALKK